DLFMIIGLLIFSTISCNSWVGHGQIFDVLKYGAKGDGLSDDSKAFVEAWKDFCGTSNGTATLVVPAGHTFFVSQTRFQGPCKSQNIDVQVQTLEPFKFSTTRLYMLHFYGQTIILGTLLAPKRNAWGTCSRRWFHFFDVPGMTVHGSGVIDGQGSDWWGNALLFERCDGLQISGLTHINGPGSHIYVVHSQDVTISNVNITSPLGSHNTDGVDLTNSVRVTIRDSIIGTGDDCIAIKGGSQFLNINNVTCGPGHGISVGSIGQGGEEEFVDHVNVSNCIFNGADSAARIKTWPGGKGYVKNIIYQNISVNQTNYPIYITQYYMGTPEMKDAVKVSDVTFSNIYGSCTGEKAVVLNCDKIGCDNITLNQINITSIDPKKPASAICNNAHGKATDIISPPVPCLNHETD
ncbi:putative polygalacturonase, partial [Mucuna pruriens]